MAGKEDPHDELGKTPPIARARNSIPDISDISHAWRAGSTYLAVADSKPRGRLQEMYAALDAWVGSEALTVLEAALGQPVAVYATPVSTPRSRRNRSSRYHKRNQGVTAVAPVRT